MPPKIGETIPINQFTKINQPTTSNVPAVGETIPLAQFNTLNKPSTQPDQSTQIDDFPTMLSKAFSGTIAGAKQIGQGFGQTIDAVKNGDVSLLGRGALNEAAGGLNTAFSPISNVLQAGAKLPIVSQSLDALKKYAIDPTSNAISDIPALQHFMTNNPNADEVAGNLITIGLALAGGNKSGEIKTVVENSLPENTPTIPENPQGPVVRTPEEIQKLQGVAQDWQKPAEVNTTGFDKARAVLSKSPETPQFLAEHGLNPFSHIEDGKYNTESTAQNLRDTPGQLSRDGLRPSLQMADYSTPKTPIIDLPSPDISKVDFAVTADDAEAIKAKVQSKLDALQRKYPDGLSLTNMLDEKITYDKNGGYSPIKDPSVTNNAIANRAIANTLRSSLEETAPADIPVKDFNAELSKYYKAADYLDTLDGKRAPASIGQQIARNVAKFGGAKIASLLPGVGGDFISEIAGYRIGKSLENFVENLTNPMRDSFLRNLKITNPEAFAKVSDYIGKQAADQATRPLLTEGRPLGTSGNPIISPAPTTYEAPAEVIRRVNSAPGKTIFDMLTKAQQKDIIDKFVNEPYTDPEKLPIIKGGGQIKPKASKLPIIK